MKTIANQGRAMNDITKTELQKVLELHRKWLASEPSGKRANLRETDLSGANLRQANLSRADLSEADLSGANLFGADLRWADLSGANLSEANLRWANLSASNLSKTDLSKADLSGANLSEADLSKADLRWADLSEANLVGANLFWANLSLVNLSGTSLFRADLRRAEYAIMQVLLADWGKVSDEICGHLMLLDASAFPDGMKLMQKWAAGGPFPLGRSGEIGRVAPLCWERRKAWNEELPPITLWELWRLLAAEKGVRI